MTANDMHKITFFWPRTDANYVVVTGTFDNWSKSIRLEKGSTGFSTSVDVPWNSTVAYKYIVDGRWMLDESKPRMVEPEGYVNNVYVVPSKPSTPTPALESPAAGIDQVSGELEPNPASSQSDKDKPLQGNSSRQKIVVEDSTIAQAIMPVPVDSQPADGQSAVMAHQNVPSRVENSNRLSDPASQPSDLPADSLVQEESSHNAEGESLVTKTAGEVSQVAAPEESRRPIHLPLLPVNVPSEGTMNGSGVTDETASTHNPLGPVNKPAPPPSTASESIPVISYVQPEGESAPADPDPEPKIPVTTYIPPIEGSGTPAGPESKAVVGGIPPDGGKELHPGEEAKALSFTEKAAPPASSDTPQPTVEDKLAELVVLPKHTNGSTGSSTLASRSSNSTSSDAATFPRASRESTDSRSSKSPPKGSPRKKRSSLLQKIKHIFSHDKSKK